MNNVGRIIDLTKYFALSSSTKSLSLPTNFYDVVYHHQGIAYYFYGQLFCGSFLSRENFCVL